MSARAELKTLLAQWLELTQAEGGAIRSASWTRVSEIQSQKAALQKSFDHAREKWAVENPAGALLNAFQTEISRLLSLEERNKTLLAAQMRRARAEQESLHEARRNLAKIRRSYIRKQDPRMPGNGTAILDARELCG